MVFMQPNERIFIPYLFIALALAYVVYQRQGNKIGFLKYCFPKEIYKHPSAKVDYGYFFINKILFLVIVSPMAFVGVGLSDFIANSLSNVAPSPLVTDTVTWWIIALYTIVLALAADFGVFYAHYITHMHPSLWHFHKVHHSAEVLTPLTLYRMHPFDQIFAVVIAGCTAAVASGLFRYLFSPDIAALSIASVGVFTLLFYVMGYNLRHSHIWLHYPKWLCAVFISPAQHQVHHSIAVKHYDKNFGLIFSFWDRLFGTLYIPAGSEEIKFGLKPYKGQRYQHNSVIEILTAPFIDLMGKKK